MRIFMFLKRLYAKLTKRSKLPKDKNIYPLF
jgi:hypothetical protein